MIRIVILACSLAYGVASATVVATAGTPERSPLLQTAPAAQASAASGKEVLQRKCSQCHQPTMWSSVRGDRTAWLGVRYRMVGRGALWTEDEINAMADFLAQTRGPK